MLRVFFDIDGVLIDGFHTKPERRKRWDEHLERDLGIRHDDFQQIFKGWFLDALQGRVDFEIEMNRWLKKNDYDLRAWQVIDYWHEKDSCINRAVFDVVKVLAARDDVLLYTATNQTHARISYLRDMLGWKDYFDDFYYSARLGCLKHDPVYFRKIEQELRFDPKLEPPLYFDDDPRNIDVAAARGWNAVAFDTADDLLTHPLIREKLS